MKAVLWTRYGPPEVLQLGEIERPVPRDHEILIKVHAATVTQGDCELRKFKIAPLIWLPMRLYMGLLKPRIKILGQEFSGVVEQVGKKVTRYKEGDAVFAPTSVDMGAYAEYKCVSENHGMSFKPARLSFEEAATLSTGGLNALCFINKAGVKAGDKVLINGAGGSIGTYAIQIAKARGAEVTAVDHGAKLDRLLAVGADYVIDYQQQDFIRNNQTYDAIIDVVGISAHAPCVRSLNPKGRLVLGNPTLAGMIASLFMRNDGKRIIPAIAGYQPEEFAELVNLVQENKVNPLIDKGYTLDRIVEAHRYVDSGRKVGSVTIVI